MKLESLKKKGASSVLITFDSGEELVLSYEIMLKWGLRTNSELTDVQFESLKEENELFYIKSNAFRYLNRRSHSEYELNLKLRRKGFHSSLIQKALDELKSLGYIDDTTFTAEFIEEKKKRGSWGNKLIEAGLKKKGIQRDIITNSLSTTSSEELKVQAIKLLEKKYRYKTVLEIIESKVKMCSYLVSKGYDYEISESAAEEYINLRQPES